MTTWTLPENEITETVRSTPPLFAIFEFRATFSRVQRRSESSRKDSSNNNEMNSAEPAGVDGSKYVEVAVPLHVSSTFIYRLPLSMRQLAQTGSRIVVPLGRTLVTGYIVALLENLRADTSLRECDIKDAKEILDAIPPVTPEL